MTCKRLACLLAIGVLLSWFPVCAHADTDSLRNIITKSGGETSQAPQSAAAPKTQKSEILIIYPNQLDSAARNSLCSVVETMTYLGHSADYLPQKQAKGRISQYQAAVCCGLKDSAETDALLAGYSGRVLLLGCLPGTVPDPARYPRGKPASGRNSAVASYTFAGNHTFTQLLTLDSLSLPQKPTYTAGSLSDSEGRQPLVMGWGTVRYLPMTDYTTSFARAVLEQETALWLWPYNDKPHSYAQFVVIDSVYPFTDPRRLLSTVKQLAEEKISFVISVMPIYQNADYPAMQQFCEVLRYAQANGGAVILHAPIVQGTLSTADLQQKLTDAANSYFANQVYPVALEIPRSWIYNEDLRTALGRYRTLFVYNDGTAGECLDLKLATNDFVRLGVQLISPAVSLDTENTGFLDCCAGAVYVDASEGSEKVMKTVRAARDSAVPLKSLWDMNQTEYFNGGQLTWDGSVLTVNGKKAALSYTPRPRGSNHDYKRTMLYRATADLQNQNHVLIVFAAAAIGIFLLCTYFARRQMHRRFFYSSGGRPSGKDVPPKKG
ncbi:MAG: DUF2334 domain-containing protein [Oscillospiraceae bacterium]|jgi:hypothetical protein|nr:DUF2334 domain-containing protein [Oscillospiraceae bacterium]